MCSSIVRALFCALVFGTAAVPAVTASVAQAQARVVSAQASVAQAQQTAVATAQAEDGIPWPAPTVNPMPPDGARHTWNACVSINGSCPFFPVGTYGGVGSIELHVSSMANQWFDTNIGGRDAYTSYVGSTKSTGVPGNWRVTVYVYKLNINRDDPNVANRGGFYFEFKYEVTGSVYNAKYTPVGWLAPNLPSLPVYFGG